MFHHVISPVSKRSLVSKSPRRQRLSLGQCVLLGAALVGCNAEPEAEDGAASGSAGASSNMQGPDVGVGSGSTTHTPSTVTGGQPSHTGQPPRTGEPSTGPIDLNTEGAEPSSSDAADPSSSDAAPPSTTPPSVGDPILPEVNGDCPDFISGTQTIMGLSTEVVAGAPGAVKGPLLFTWHGTGGNGRQALRQLPQSVQDDIVAQGGIIIAPSDNGQVRAGRDVTFVLGVWYDGADLNFADQIVACAVKEHNIDPRRIYVTGCSAGGLMAGVMSLERSDYVAAAAPNSGGLATGQFRLENEAHVPAVMSMYGGDSDTVVVNFGDTTRTLTEALKPKGSFVVECNHGMGHCGAPASLHEKAWEFMKAHPFGTKPSPYAAGLPGDFPEFCTIQ
jgi:predicted esterase